MKRALEKEDLIYPPLALLIFMTLLVLIVTPFVLSWLLFPIWGASLVVAVVCMAIGFTMP